MKVEIIQDRNKFRNMSLEWNSLLEKSNVFSVYLSWEWLYTWWEIFGKTQNWELFIVTVRENGELVGIAPFIKRQIKVLGIINRISIEFLGTGEDEKDEVCSNYLDIIVKANSKEVYDLIFEHMEEGLKKKYWNDINLKNLSISSDTVKFFRNREYSEFSKRFSKPVSCAIINLPEQYDIYLQNISKSWRAQIRRGRKKILGKGAINCNLVSSPEEISDAFCEFINLHQKRWQEVSKPGIFASEKFTNFHKRILELFSQKNWVGIRLLRCNGQLVAASYCFRYNKTIYFYSSAYDRAFKTKVGIGVIERSYDIEDAIKNGYRYYDFYKAKNRSYKWNLAKEKREVQDILVFRKDCEYYLSIGIRYLKAFRRKVRSLCRGKQKI